MKIKGRNWWGKRPKNSWSAKNKMHSILKSMRNGEDMTHGISAETEKAGGGALARQSAEEWHTELHKGTIRPQDIKYILWDWVNDRTELIHLLQSLEWEGETIDGVSVCPECGASRDEGHHKTCKLGKVLA